MNKYPLNLHQSKPILYARKLEDLWANLLALFSYLKTLFILQIVFEAVRGISYRGDIALDDISLKDGSCPSSGNFLKSGILQEGIIFDIF